MHTNGRFNLWKKTDGFLRLCYGDKVINHGIKSSITEYLCNDSGNGYGFDDNHLRRVAVAAADNLIDVAIISFGNDMTIHSTCYRHNLSVVDATFRCTLRQEYCHFYNDMSQSCS